MKKLCLPCILCLILFSACSSNGKEELLRATVSSSQITGSVSNSEAYPSFPPETEPQRETAKLSQADIDSICDRLYVVVFHCGDGSQILAFHADEPEGYIYIRYVPQMLPNGDYKFFHKLSPSYNVSYKEDGSAEIPVCINDSGDFRFVIKVKYLMFDGKVEINNKTFTFLNNDDKDFNEMYATLDYNAQNDYCMSLIPDKNLTDEELTKFLKACIYNGNMNVLDELYKVIPDDDLESRYKLELAGFLSPESGISLSAANPYQSEIFYDESCKDFPQDDTLAIVAKSMQTGKSLKKLGAEEIEPNYDWENVYKIPNLHDFYEYLKEDQDTCGIYKFDLDNDGLMEILIFIPGGTIGNEFWEILHLDKAGRITNTNSGEGLRSMSLYRYKENYFFLSQIVGFNNKEFLGWEVYSLNKEAKMYRADIWIEKVGSQIVFNDNHSETDDGFYLDWELDSFIDTYKSFEYEAIGKEIESNKKVQELFDEPDEPNGLFGVLDVNNDNVDDWTNVFMFFTGKSLYYYCNYKFVDGKTNQLLDFFNYFRGQNICCIIPYQFGDKNYFICVLNGYGNYIIKLIEIKGIEPVELKSWLVSVKNRILIQVFENMGSHIGL